MEKDEMSTVTENTETAVVSEQTTSTESNSNELKAKSADIGAQVNDLLNKRFGNFTLKQILIVVLCVLLAVVVLKAVLGNAFKGNKVPDYSIVYVNDDGDLMVVGKNGKDPVKLSSDGYADVEYANTTDRYILFTKDDSLYLYDKKDKDNTEKIAKEVSRFGFSDDDKYIYYLNDDDELYSYYKKEIKIDTDVDSIAAVTEDKIFYVKDDELFFRSLKGKGDKVKVESELNDYLVNEDGSKILYENEDNELYVYKVSSKKSTKIADDISNLLDWSEDLNELIYSTSDDEVYYAKGTKTTKLVSDVEGVFYSDVDNKVVVYETDDVMYYQKGTGKAIKVEDSEDVRSVYIYNDKELYFTKYDDGEYELFYSKLSGSKASSPKSVLDDASSYITSNYKNGLIAFSNVDDYIGEFNVIKNGKVTKVADDVYVSSMHVDVEGKKVFFLGDYDDEDNVGTFMSTTGKKSKKLVEDVSDYTYIHSKLVYLETGYSSKSGNFDIQVFTGSKAKELVTDVSRVHSVYVPSYTK